MQKLAVTILAFILLSGIVGCTREPLSPTPSITSTVSPTILSTEVPQLSDADIHLLEEILTEEFEKAKKAFYDCQDQLQLLVDEICLPENPEEFGVHLHIEPGQPRIIDQSPYPSDEVMNQIRQLARVMEFTCVFVDEERISFAIYADWPGDVGRGVYIDIDYVKKGFMESRRSAEMLAEDWYIIGQIVDPECGTN